MELRLPSKAVVWEGLGSDQGQGESEHSLLV